MGDVWYPGAQRDPGAGAGYRQGGPTGMLSAVVHYTVGRDSTGLIRDQGLAQFLASRDGTMWQYAEVNAVCYHAGYPFNGLGPGIEVEYLPGVDDVMFTPEALAACRGLVQWLHSDWGLPLDYYDDPNNRVASHAGFISHRSVIEDAAYHNDYWERADWDAMVTAPVPPPTPTLTEENPMTSVLDADGTAWYWFIGIDGNIYRQHKAKGDAAWSKTEVTGDIAGAPKPTK